MEFTDRVLKCVDCGAEFVFTAGEQLFFHDKQFKNDPKHCKQCKAKRARGVAACAPRDADHLLRVRRGDDRSLQADAGTAGAVPVVLSESSRAKPAGGACGLAQRRTEEQVAPEP